MSASAVAPFRHPYGVDVPLVLTLVNADGTGATAKTPQVAIRRLASAAGALLDLQYWDGSAFTASETWLNMTEVSAAQNPGRYRYLFDAPLVEQSYLVLYRHTTDPIGIDTEVHTITKQVDPSAGARAIAISVVDASDDPVPGVVVDVYDSSNTLHLLRATDLDLDGAVAFNLEDGTYKVRLSGPRFTPTNAVETLVVNGDETVEYDGTVLTPPVAADPGLCRVWGYLVDASGAEQNDVTISFYSNAPLGVGDYVMSAKPASVVTGAGAWADGYFEIDLVRGATVRLKAAYPKLDALVITVPDAGSAELADLIEDAK